MPEYDLAKSFVEGNVQNKFYILAEAIHDFIVVISKVIEDVKILFDRLYAIPFGNIRSEELRKVWQEDLAQAEKFLSMYNRIFGRVDLNLGLIASTYDLPNFLIASGCPKELLSSVVSVVQADVRQYWESSYGAILMRFNALRDDLKDLRDVLDKEILLLKQLPYKPYFEALDIVTSVKELFERERTIFWNRLVRDAKITDEEVGIIRNVFFGHQQRLKSMAVAHLGLLKKNIERDISASQTSLQRAILLLFYLWGAYKTLTELKKKLSGKAGEYFAVSAISMAQRFFQLNPNVIERAQVAMKNLCSENVEALIATL
ncbi:MAG: hypothetical protein Q7K43_04400 [Candidatus Woesearchaeota archaeon]|nr:hypothetical protein [Candidatus Woesearchaeota archaeon]